MKKSGKILLGIFILASVLFASGCKHSPGTDDNTNIEHETAYTTNNITVTQNDKEYFLILTPSAGFETYTWTLNGQTLDISCSVDNETHALTFYKSRASYGTGDYTFTLKATKDGITYTTSTEYNVEHAPTEMDMWEYCSNVYYSIVDGVVHISGTGAMTVMLSYMGWYEAPSALKNATNFIIEDGITEIGDGCFRGFDHLKKISGGNDVKKIGEGAFWTLTSLETIHGFANLTTIETEAFYSCSSLSNVEFGGTEAQWNAITIGNDNERLTSATRTYNNK